MLIIFIFSVNLTLAALGDPTCFGNGSAGSKTTCIGGNSGNGNFSGNVTALYYYGDGSKLTNISTGSGNGNYSQFTNISNLNVNTTTLKTTGGILDIVSSFFTNLFYMKSEVYNKTEIDELNLTINTKIDNLNTSLLSTIQNANSTLNNNINTVNTSLTNQIQNINNSIANMTSYAPIAKVNFTSGTYNGSLRNGSLVGYRAGHAICQSQFANSFMCGQEDINDYLGNNKTFTVSTDAWIFAGGPKYVPATISMNDCMGFTTDQIGTSLGNYFKTNITSGSGTFNGINCQTQIQLACCSRV